MRRRWKIHEAKNKFSQVVEAAVSHGPQIITKHGVETAVVISYVDYLRHNSNRKKLTQFLRESPLVAFDLDITRDNSLPRNV